MLALALESLENDKAGAIRVVPLAGKSPIADYMVIATGTSTRHVSAMADHLLQKLKQNGVRGASVEGRAQCDWVLVDAGDIVVHLFRPEVRDHYNLEKLWDDELAGQSALA